MGRPWIAILAWICGGCMAACAPGKIARVTAPSATLLDPVLREIVETRSFTQGLPSGVEVATGGAHVLFLRTGARDRTQRLFAFDVAKGTTTQLAPRGSGVEGALTKEEIARRERQRIVGTGIAWFVASPEGHHVLVSESGLLTVIALAGGKAVALAGTEGATDPKFSPDETWVSFVKDHDLWICRWRTGELHAVTTGGTEDLSHGEAEFVAQEEMNRFSGYEWSPDSKHIAWEESDTRAVEKVWIADPSNPGRAPVGFAYPRPGKANAIVRLAISEISGAKKPRWVEWDRAKFPYLATIAWAKDAPLTILVQSRDQREEVLLAVDAATGATRELLRETDAAWIYLRQSVPHWVAGGTRFLWLSEADGEWRLSVRDAKSGKTITLNPGNEFRVKDLVHVDEDRGVAIVSGCENPVETHLWELPLAGGKPVKLTREAGEHAGFFAARTNVHARQRSTSRALPEVEVFRADGSSAGKLPSEGAAPPWFPNVELVNVAADTKGASPGIHYDAAVLRPRAFQAGTKYPVIVLVYGGPSDGLVHDTLAGSSWFRLQWYADQGFIVVTSDNRGILNRGREWSRAIAGDTASVPIADQVEALHALAARIPEMDLSRVGIMGWSYGGYMSALAVTRRGDVFKAAVAGAPVVDWTDYDTHYTERYLGTPESNPSGYAASSVLTGLSGLTRPLLIVHGTADDNVYFSNSLKLADALFRAGKRFELVPVAGATHMAIRVPETALPIEVRSAAFFREHL